MAWNSSLHRNPGARAPVRAAERSRRLAALVGREGARAIAGRLAHFLFDAGYELAKVRAQVVGDLICAGGRTGTRTCRILPPLLNSIAQGQFRHE